MQQVDVRLRSAIIETAAVSDALDVARSIRSKDNRRFLVGLLGMECAHITGILIFKDDVMLLYDIRRGFSSLQFRPEDDGLGLVAGADIDRILA